MANFNPDTSGLISLADRPDNEKTTIQSKGGKASGVARREKNKMRQILVEALMHPYEDWGNKKEAMAVALINQALKGDIRAFETIMKFTGEMPSELEQMATDEELAHRPWARM